MTQEQMEEMLKTLEAIQCALGNHDNHSHDNE